MIIIIITIIVIALSIIAKGDEQIGRILMRERVIERDAYAWIL